MWNIEILRERGFLLAVLLVLSVSILVIWVYVLWREARIAADLTPEAVVQKLQNAGFQINDVQELDYFPGPMPIGKGGVDFSVDMENETVHVLVALYSDSREARQVTDAINDLNLRTNGRYGYAFCRGPIVLQVDTPDKSMAREFNAVLKEAE